MPIAHIFNPETGAGGTPTVPAVGGINRVPFQLSWMTEFRDASSLLTGSVVDEGDGRIKFPTVASVGVGNTRVNSFIATAPISVLAAALNVPVSDITDGTLSLEILATNYVTNSRMGVGFLLSDRGASDQVNNRALACGISQNSATLNFTGAAACKSNSSGGTTARIDPDNWGRWLMRASTDAGTPDYTSVGTLWYPDDDDDAYPYANSVFKEANALVDPTHFGILLWCRNQPGGSPSDTIVTLTVAAISNADATGQP